METLRFLANRFLSDAQRKRIKAIIHGLQRIPLRLTGAERLIGAQRGEIERLKSKLVLLEGRLNLALYGLPAQTQYRAELVSAGATALAASPAHSLTLPEGQDAENERFQALQSRASGFNPVRAMIAGSASPASLRAILRAFPSLGELCVCDPDPRLLESSANGTGPAKARAIQAEPVDALLALSESRFELIASLRRYCCLAPRDQERLVDLCLERLAPGGLLYLEIPRFAHPAVSSDSFWMESTHLRPYSLELLRRKLPGASFVELDPAGAQGATLGVLFRKGAGASG